MPEFESATLCFKVRGLTSGYYLDLILQCSE